MQLEKRALYRVETPIDTSKVARDLQEVRNQLAPGTHTREELIDFIIELDKYRITVNSSEKYIAELVRGFYDNKMLECGDITFLLNQFDSELVYSMTEAAMILNVDEGKISLKEYVEDYDEIQDEIMMEFDEYTDLEHLVADSIDYDSFEVSATSFEDEEYFEYTGIEPEELKALSAMKLIDKDIKIYTNDCQEILIPELMQGSCVFTGDGNINYYKYIEDKERDRKLIGG